MTPEAPAPEVAPLDDARLQARQAHLERELGRAPAPTSKRRRTARGAVLVAVFLAVVAVVVTGRDGGPDALARARAAVSRGPYLGISLEADRAPHISLVHLAPRSVERTRQHLELWFDTRKHGRAASVGGCIRLVGPQTRTGCLGAVFGGSPTAFTGAVDHYRSALANGSVKKAGDATVRGKRVWWLRVAPQAPPLLGYTLFVAVDQKTGDPLRIETRKAGHVVDGENVDVIAETRSLPAYVTAATTPPPASLAPGRQHARSGADVSLAEAAKLVPGALWPGRSAAGEPFRRARLITLDDGARQLELLYGKACPNSCILIKQGFEAGWAPGDRVYATLPNRTIVVTGRSGNGHDGRLKIRLAGTSPAAILAATRALRPL